ncbi:MAG: phosphoribosylformylglycinamidine synthase subunit PurL [Bradymonadia bacterium]
MIHRFDVSARPGHTDPRGPALAAQIAQLGVSGLTRITVGDVFFLQTDDDADLTQVDAMARELLWDPVVQEGIRTATQTALEPGQWSVEVVCLPGVTDAQAESLLEGERLAGFEVLQGAATGRRYLLEGELTEEVVRRIARGLLANEVVESLAINAPVKPPLGFVSTGPTGIVEHVALADLDDEGLLAVSAERRLSLDLKEMQALQGHYRALDRAPTDVELETFAQTWSEHCVHKTFRARITYTERDADGVVVGEPLIVDGLLNDYIRKATKDVAKPWVHSAFVDNAGIIAFDDGGPDDRVDDAGRPLLDLAFKAETHNRPSALEPFGGANTGVGGVIRDVLGVSARPIANTDVLCFGPPDLAFEDLPEGVLHPQRIAAGVIDGVEDYGNKMGIPTVNGGVLYDAGYTANPLVYVGCLGVLPRGSHPTAAGGEGAMPGDKVVVLGGRTGRDGLRGATFSSMEMDHQTTEVSGSAVQIGHPIHEKQVMEALLVARDQKLYTAVTDCGAGGLSSAVGEMSEKLGASVNLDLVPLKYPGLQPWEIWLSEAQERMVMAVPPSNIDALMAICEGVDVEATVLGEFTGDGVLSLTSEGREVGRFDCAFLHKGIPRKEMVAEWAPSALPVPEVQPEGDLTADLLALLAHPNTRSKADVVHRYDHEVQGGTVGKPLVGDDGHGDAAVLVPFEAWRGEHETQRGCALSVGINPEYGKLDPYNMAWAVVDEAFRNAVSVGADPDRMAILDNFCWGNPRLPDRLGALVRCAQGCYDAAVAYSTPFVSGKDSLNNEYTDAEGNKVAIPGTLLLSAVGIVPDVSKTISACPKASGDLVWVIGTTGEHLGGSAWHRHHGSLGGQPPEPVHGALDQMRVLHQAILAGEVNACHDVSEGGLAVALAEMAISCGMGLRANLRAAPMGTPLKAGALLFSESLTRFVITTRPEQAEALRSRLSAGGVPFAEVGQIADDARVRMRCGDGHVDTDVAALSTAWRGHLEGGH